MIEEALRDAMALGQGKHVAITSTQDPNTGNVHTITVCKFMIGDRDFYVITVDDGFMQPRATCTGRELRWTNDTTYAMTMLGEEIKWIIAGCVGAVSQPGQKAL